MTPTDDWLTAFLAAERLPASYAQTIEAVAAPLAQQIAGRVEQAGALAHSRLKDDMNPTRHV